MKRFGEFLSRLGNLHDCTVTVVEWSPGQKAMRFEIEDLYFNFESLSEYRGPLAGRIALEEIERLTMELRDFEGPLRIDEFSIGEQGQAGIAAVTITFWPAGNIKATCRRMVFPDISLPPR